LRSFALNNEMNYLSKKKEDKLLLHFGEPIKYCNIILCWTP